MAGPMQIYLYVHDALMREVADFEETARELNRDDADEVAAFSQRVAWFQRMNAAHEDTEESVLFPALESRYPHIAASYEFDHDHLGLFDEMDASLAGLGRSDGNGDRSRMAQLLHWQSIALNQLMRLHATKENELLLPVLDREFDLEEQVSIAGRMAARVEQPLLMEMISWMYLGQTADDREGMLRALTQALPPEAFGGVASMLSRTGSPDAWQEMERRIPSLVQKVAAPPDPGDTEA